MKNAFTVDFEDWYQGIELPYESWPGYEDRIEIGLNRVLDILERHNAKATFFMLGWMAKKYPGLVKKVADAGHELGSHGYSHEKVYNQSVKEFREEIKLTKAVLEDLTGQKVIAHRSPFFSITSKSLWALSVLKEEGFEIDSSISPIKTWRYGVSTCPDNIFKIKELDLIEFPVSCFSFLLRNWAIGGAYFRLFPYEFTRWAIRRRNREGYPAIFYMHPWEIDPRQPRQKGKPLSRFRQYNNLDKTENRLKALLRDFDFIPVRTYLDMQS